MYGVGLPLFHEDGGHNKHLIFWTISDYIVQQSC